MENIVQQSLHKLMRDLQQAAAASPQLMMTEFEPQLTSPCYIGNASEG